jgi:hypothetical protein
MLTSFPNYGNNFPDCYFIFWVIGMDLKTALSERLEKLRNLLKKNISGSEDQDHDKSWAMAELSQIIQGIENHTQLFIFLPEKTKNILDNLASPSLDDLLKALEVVEGETRPHSYLNRPLKDLINRLKSEEGSARAFLEQELISEIKTLSPKSLKNFLEKSGVDSSIIEKISIPAMIGNSCVFQIRETPTKRLVFEILKDAPSSGEITDETVKTLVAQTLRQGDVLGNQDAFCEILLARLNTLSSLETAIDGLSDSDRPVDKLVDIIINHRQPRKRIEPKLFENPLEVVQACPRIIDIINALDQEALGAFMSGIEGRSYPEDFGQFCDFIEHPEFKPGGLNPRLVMMAIEAAQNNAKTL